MGAMVTNHVYDKEHNTTEINIDLAAQNYLQIPPVSVSMCLCVCRVFNLQENEANCYIINNIIK